MSAPVTRTSHRQAAEPRLRVMLYLCRVVELDRWCHKSGGQGLPWDTANRRLAHEPFGYRSTELQISRTRVLN